MDKYVTMEKNINYNLFGIINHSEMYSVVIIIVL